ncbi:MAG: tetratricopeptide repeat protein, partial [bacterium]|nr:tetratricopeptide repeat protein [bacterium]
MTHPWGLLRLCVVWALPIAICLALAPAAPARADAKSELRFQQGIAAYGAREFGAAREAFQSFLNRNPADPTALRYLGLISRAEDRDQEAIDFFRRALDLAPTDVLTYVALSESLLRAEQNVPAQEALTTALALAPTHARLHLYKGIAEYRLRNLTVAVGHFERAAALDPNMEREARYYTGLSHAILGNLYTAAQAFTEVSETSPAHPLGRSSRNLRDAMEPETPEQRWNVNATTGIEFDTNPKVVGETGKAESDFAASIGVRGLVDAYRGPGVTVRAGYDGFLLKYIESDEVDEQTHVARGVVLYDVRNARMSLRYDGSFTALEFGDPFRLMNVLEPSLSVRVGRLGITQGFYQLYRFDYFDEPNEEALDLDGWQHTLGVTQSFIPPEPFTQIRVGFEASLRDTDGAEFDHKGLSAHVGAAALLPWYDIEISGLYRFSHQRYSNESVFNKKGDRTERRLEDEVKRSENSHEITVNLNVPLWRRLSLDVAGAFAFSDSEIEFFRYDRQTAGTYLTWDLGGKPTP